MKPLSESQINLHSPYKVTKDQSNTITFLTENGVLYRVGFAEDTILGVPNVFQIYVENVCDIKMVVDDKVRQTITCILKNFFSLDNYVLLFVCDVRDGRQVARNRLFTSWYNKYEEKDSYMLKTAKTNVEGTCYFVSLMVARNNPICDFVIGGFEEFVVDIENK